MSAHLYINLVMRPTMVDETFFRKLDTALASQHFLLASESPKPGEMVAYKFKIKSDSPSEFIPWPDYTRSFDRDEMLHIRYECGPCPSMQAIVEHWGEPVTWGMTCWLFFPEPQIVKGLHFETGPEYRLLPTSVGSICLEHLKRFCDTVHQRLAAIDTALFRDNEDEGEKLPEPQRLLYRVDRTRKEITNDNAA
jgi:hypothetical protein